MDHRPVTTIVLVIFLILIACEIPLDTDQEAPVITILNPAEGYISNDSILIQVEANDNRGVAGVEFWIDSALVNTDNESPWEYLWITSGYEEGSQHSLFIQAHDSSGNVGTSIVIQLLINSFNTVPTPSFFVTPSSGTPTTTFYFDASDCNDLEDSSSALQVRWDWENDGTWDTGYTTTKTDTHQYSGNGSYTVNMEVKDSEGATADTTQTIQVEEESITTVTDIDGNVYRTVTIGSQEWMVENLKVTHYSDGTAITHVTDNADWATLTEAYCIYNNNASNEVDTYGALYNGWAVADGRNIAPEGWHVPTDDEWRELEMYLGMSQSDADITGWRGTNEGSKLAGNAELWNSEALESNAEFGSSGFTALPGGYRDYYSGTYGSMSLTAYFWSATEFDSLTAWSRKLHFLNSGVNRDSTLASKRYGLSVRCVKGEPEVNNTAPMAEFKVEPTSGTTSTTFIFDASSSSDLEDTEGQLEVRWDWEEDGIWDTEFTRVKTASHQYTSAGTYLVDMQVSDSGGLTDIFQETVNVTNEGGTVSDIDGNIYHTVIIGEQEWMAENLKVTRYRDGTEMTNVTDNTAWAALTTEAYSIYNNNSANEVDTYGALYNWYAVNDSRNIAPEGWHVPTDAEWIELEMALGMNENVIYEPSYRGTNEGSKLAGNAALWNSGALEDDTEFGSSGFTALPCGSRDNNDGYYRNIGMNSYFWSITETNSNTAWDRELEYGNSDVGRHSHNKRTGLAIRCIRGEAEVEPDNSAPIASFGVNPPSGTTSTIFMFDASSSSDLEDTEGQLEVRWDWEEDGIWDTDFSSIKTASHQYEMTGTYLVDMQVRDSGGLTDIYQQTVNVMNEVGSVTDIDGNIYRTVIIGEQEWMAENLKVTHYRDDTEIPNITDNAAWAALTTEAYTIYNNNSANEVDTYGALYNWYAVNDSRNIAPEGWHTPTDDEWKELEMYLGMSQADADIEGWRGTHESSKLAGNASLWNDGILKNDSEFGISGFDGLPGGFRHWSAGGFGNIGNHSYYWCATEFNSNNAWSRLLSYNSLMVARLNNGKIRGFSIRCIKD
jgi:uncharacterized protein (TIGR02145 family)